MVESNNAIIWDAEEHIQREKNTGWYIGLILIGAIFVALSIWQQWWTFTALVVLCIISLIIYSVRPPRKLHYVLDEKGLKEDNRLFEYKDFKAFGILNEDNNYSIILIPRKRFSPRVTVFFPKDSGEKIVDAFGMRLPMEQIKLDVIDRLVKFLRI